MEREADREGDAREGTYRCSSMAMAGQSVPVRSSHAAMLGGSSETGGGLYQSNCQSSRVLVGDAPAASSATVQVGNVDRNDPLIPRLSFFVTRGRPVELQGSS